MISRTCASLLGVGGGWPAWAGGRLQRIVINFWNGNTTQMSSIDLGRTLRKLLAAFRTFQHQFSPDGNRNWWTHTAELSPPSWDATHTASRRSVRGFHRANAGRYRLPVMQVHLHSFHLSCLVATSLRIIASPKRKSVPELNDQPSCLNTHLDNNVNNTTTIRYCHNAMTSLWHCILNLLEVCLRWQTLPQCNGIPMTLYTALAGSLLALTHNQTVTNHPLWTVTVTSDTDSCVNVTAVHCPLQC
jgi:hypothetical protein